MQTDTTLAIRETFEGHPLTFVTFRGQPLVVAREMGTALGYSDPSRLGWLIRNEWSGEFVEGSDYTVLDGSDLSAFKAEWPDTASDAVSTLDRTRRALMVLTESGWWLVAQKTEKALGVKLRRLLAERVLPKLARGEPIGAPAEPTPKPSEFDPARLREVRLAGDRFWRAGLKDEARAVYRTMLVLIPGAEVQAAPPATVAPSPQLALPLASKRDPWAALVEVWAAKGGHPMTTTDLLHLADREGLLKDELHGHSGHGRASAFGRLLWRQKRITVGGKAIVAYHDGGRQWWRLTSMAA